MLVSVIRSNSFQKMHSTPYCCISNVHAILTTETRVTGSGCIEFIFHDETRHNVGSYNLKRNLLQIEYRSLM